MIGIEAARRGRRGAHRSSWRRTLYWFLGPAVVFIVVFTLYPIIYNFVLSTQRATLMTLATPGARIFIGLDNYIAIFKRPGFLQVIANSFVFTAGSVAFQFTLGFLLALFFIKRFPASNFVRGSIVLGWVLPPVVVGTIWSWILNSDVGILNFLFRAVHLTRTAVPWLTSTHTAMYGVLISNIWFGIPFNMMLLLGGLSGLPEEIFEVASIDGANAAQKFFFLTIPLMRRSIGATIMLGVIYTFQVFALIWVMTGGGPVNATNILTTFSYQLAFNFYNFGQGTAAASLLFVVMFVISLFYIRNY